MLFGDGQRCSTKAMDVLLFHGMKDDPVAFRIYKPGHKSVASQGNFRHNDFSSCGLHP